MPPSMRRQAADHKRRITRLQEQANQRLVALQMLREGHAVRSIARATGFSRGTVQRLRKCLTDKDEGKLSHLTSTTICAGRPRTITNEEATLLNSRLKLASKRGFAVNNSGFKHVLYRIAADGRNGYRNGIPSDAAVRTYRAHNPDITYKRIENKEFAKLAAESYRHIDIFFAALDEIQVKHPGILLNPHRIWNLDETAVDCTLGKLEKAFTSRDTKNGGHRAVKSRYGSSKHVTVVIAASGAGVLTPPFFIVAGKRMNSDWYAPVQGRFQAHPQGIIKRFTKPNWFPKDGCIKLTENSFMEGPVLAAFVQHLQHTAVKYLKEGENIPLFLDGHSSRKHPAWIEFCFQKCMEAVINAANTSHILQPCDQLINKRFHELLREIRDEFCRQSTCDTTKVNFNLACAVYAWEGITPELVQASFKVTGTFPFQRNFGEKYKTFKDEQEELLKRKEKLLLGGSVASRVAAVRKRHSDQEVFNEMMAIISSNVGVSVKIKDIMKLLKQEETVNSILMKTITRSVTNTVTPVNETQRVLYDAGAPAEWVTHGDQLRRREEAEEERKRVEMEKLAEKTRKAAERIRAREEAEKVAEARMHEREKKRQQKLCQRAERRVELLKRREQRENLAKERMHVNVLKQKARALSRKIATERRSNGFKTVTRGGRQRRTPISSFQFAAEVVLEALCEAVEVGIDRFRTAQI